MNASTDLRPLCGRLARGVLAAGLLAAFAQPSQAEISLTLDKPVHEPGETIHLLINGDAGDVLFFFISPLPGPLELPKIGTLDVGPAPVGILSTVLPAPGDCDIGLPIDCDSALIDGPLFVQIAALNPQTKEVSVSERVTLDVVAGDCGGCVRHADLDDYGVAAGGHALYLPGIGTDFVFVGGGALVEHADGTARLTGLVARESDDNKRFLVDVHLEDRVGKGDPEPAGSPKLELDPSAYEDGMPVDPRLWHYYETFEGTLVGQGDLEGGVLCISRHGPAFQVGRGANGKNIGPGASGWLDVEVCDQPDDDDCEFPDEPAKGDFNLDLLDECVECPSKAKKHAVWIPHLSKQLVFDGDHAFTESDDGTARLQGALIDKDDPVQHWTLDVLFAERVDPGSADHPPAGSPKHELADEHYVDEGGPVDPDTWRYYLVTEGVLIGTGPMEGALLRITRMGPAFQVGYGASGKSVEYGASGWFHVEIESQPDNGWIDEDADHGDINISLAVECP